MQGGMRPLSRMEPKLMTTELRQREPFALNVLHPKMMGPITDLARAMRTIHIGGYVLEPFEGFRHPQRQYDLLARTKNTKAGPWQSSHQYGLAVDFAGLRIIDQMILPGSWAWDQVPEALWLRLKREAVRFGLDVPIAWDRGHVEHPLFADYRKLLK